MNFGGCPFFLSNLQHWLCKLHAKAMTLADCDVCLEAAQTAHPVGVAGLIEWRHLWDALHHVHSHNWIPDLKDGAASARIRVRVDLWA